MEERVPMCAVYMSNYGPVRISEREESILKLWEEYQQGRILLIREAGAKLGAKAEAILSAIEKVGRWKMRSALDPSQPRTARSCGFG